MVKKNVGALLGAEESGRGRFPPIKSTCLSVFGTKVFFSSELPWNARTEEYNGEGLMTSGFETGGYLNALEHLLTCEKCRNLNGLSLKEIKRLLSLLDEEWRKLIREEE